MYLYGYFNDEIPKVSLGSIKFLTSQLNEFLAIYEKKVLIDDPEIRENVERLKQILTLLKQQRYNELIAEPNLVIDFNDDNEEYLPEYYPI